jgi:hypothetical protein
MRCELDRCEAIRLEESVELHEGKINPRLRRQTGVLARNRRRIGEVDHRIPRQYPRHSRCCLSAG